MGYVTPKRAPKPRSLSAPSKKPKVVPHTPPDEGITKINFLNFIPYEMNSELIKSYQKRDIELTNERNERCKVKKGKSFEDIHPFRSNPRFNSSRFLTSSMIDLSSYNNPTQSSQAKATTNFNINHSSNAANIQTDLRTTSLMQIEHVPRLRMPAWRKIS